MRRCCNIMSQYQQFPATLATVKWYDAERGFGFACCDDKSRDAFLHRSCVAASGLKGLTAGDRIEVASIQTEKGRQATRVKLVASVAT
jgi:CspA family cold shock protein